MKTLSASLIIFIILMSCVSGAFADERLEAGYLPKDRDSIVWVSEGERGSYVGRDGNNYLFNIFPYEHDRAKFILSVTEAYSFFGFSTVPQYVVEDANQFIESNNAQASVIVTKIDPGLKNIDDCSVACREKLNEQLAKLHLAEALMAINGTHISRFNEQINYYVDQDGRLNIVCLNCSYTINSERRKIVLDIKKLIEFKHNWNKARIFQKPFLDYTLTHIPGLVSWLENIYAAKIKNQDISEGDETESGFKSIIEQLKMLQKEGYKPDGPEKISRLIKERRGRKLDKRSGFKKAYFDARDILPKIEEQILLCNDGVKVWLELTNFQSLVNGQESNKIVTVYIGDVGDKKKADRKIIEIFDPEATFVFQTEVIGWWGNNDRGISSPSKLAEAILNGFKGVSEHFDFQEKFLQEGNQSIVSIEDLIDFCNQQQEKFKSITHGIDRFVTMGTINKRKAQGLGAYYPNPIYLKSMFNYKRPQGMSYDEYLKRVLEEILFGMDMACDKDDISKTDDADYNFCDEYTQILERVYPGALNNSCSSIDNIHVSEFNRKSVYAFRGNDNSLDDVYAANGFWAEGDGDAKFSDKETKER
ncbi:MAG: hypothetical protein KKE11_03250 [Gammaproteobacteria bacterium]|nr:hypothetical protein [Gammaproteobacteria bacterium]